MTEPERTRPPVGPRPDDLLRDLYGTLDGARVPGGCRHCAAYQTLAPVEAGLWTVTVHHDDRCPWFRRRGASDPSGSRGGLAAPTPPPAPQSVTAEDDARAREGTA